MIDAPYAAEYFAVGHTPARYIKAVQTGTSTSWWSMTEFNACSWQHPDGGAGRVAGSAILPTSWEC